MNLRSIFAIFIALVLFVFCGSDNRIVIASKNFSEQVLLGEILAQHIENNCDVKVNRKLNLGGTFICHKALVSGEVDGYIEYTGTALTAILKRDPINDPEEVYQLVKQEYMDQFDLECLDPLGFNNTFAIIVRGEDARRFGLKTISDAAKITPQWQAGFGYEFMERKDGFPGLASLYGLRFRAAPRIMDLTLTYKAVADKQVDFIAGNSTDGLISKFDLVVLEDDRSYFPPYYAVPIFREDTLERVVGLRDAVNRLGGTINEDEMRRLNYMVDVELKDVRQVASQFLKQQFGE